MMMQISFELHCARTRLTRSRMASHVPACGAYCTWPQHSRIEASCCPEMPGMSSAVRRSASRRNSALGRCFIRPSPNIMREKALALKPGIMSMEARSTAASVACGGRCLREPYAL